MEAEDRAAAESAHDELTVALTRRQTPQLGWQLWQVRVLDAVVLPVALAWQTQVTNLRWLATQATSTKGSTVQAPVQLLVLPLRWLLVLWLFVRLPLIVLLLFPSVSQARASIQQR